MIDLTSRFGFDRLVARYAVLCATALIVMFAVSRWGWGDANAIDRSILIGLRRHAAQPGELWTVMKQFMLFLTAIGSFPVLAVLTLIVAGVLIWAQRARVAARLVTAAGSGMAAANLLKLVVGRARPEVVPHWIEVSSLSFPSGHTSDSSIAYLLITMIAIDATRRIKIRQTIGIGAVGLVVLIGTSRIYLGVHWPTDVLAGWAFGSTWVLLVAPVLRGPD